jgi:circadian clock protein KaiC
LLDVYVGAEGVLTGSARLSQEAKNEEQQLLRSQDIVRKQLELERKREAMEARITMLRSEFDAEESETLKVIRIETASDNRFARDKAKMARSRGADVQKEKPRTKHA